MADQLAQSLSSMSISPETVAHPAATDGASWASHLPAGVQATKTLLFKPKTAKNAPVKPVVVIALDSTDVGSANVIAKEVGIKEMRAAAEDVWTQWFGADKDAGEATSSGANERG